MKNSMDMGKQMKTASHLGTCEGYLRISLEYIMMGVSSGPIIGVLLRIRRSIKISR